MMTTLARSVKLALPTSKPLNPGFLKNVEDLDMQKQLLNQTDAAEFFGVSRRTIHEWRKAGFGPTWFKLPGGREVTTLKSCEQAIDDLNARLVRASGG
jgi:hypothetical protein